MGGLPNTLVSVRSMAGAESNPTEVAALVPRPGTRPMRCPSVRFRTMPGVPSGVRPRSNVPMAIVVAANFIMDASTPRTRTTWVPTDPPRRRSRALPSTYGAAAVT